MARPKKAYVCSDCGAYSVKWQGQCPDCDAWNSLTQTTLASGSAVKIKGPEPTILANLTEDTGLRHPTGFEEFDRVLGGGLVPGSVVLLGGDPGVGKSTLIEALGGRLSDPFAAGRRTIAGRIADLLRNRRGVVAADSRAFTQAWT